MLSLSCFFPLLQRCSNSIYTPHTIVPYAKILGFKGLTRRSRARGEAIVSKNLDRIFISIGVSKPDGGLVELPGAISASERMATWAEANGYIPILVNDTLYPEVTIELLRDKITTAIEEVTNRASLRRLIIFFAGHGVSLGIDDQNWLLSNWKKRSSEVVNITSLVRALEYHGPLQVSIIGDACQEFSAKFMEVVAGPVLDTTDENRRSFELDKFFPVDSGSKAYMIKAKGDDKAFCLFTEVMLDALEGDAPDKYFEKDSNGVHVTSQSLANFLRENLNAEAGKYGEIMQPHLRPGFYTDRNYFSRPPTSGAEKPPKVNVTAGLPPSPPKTVAPTKHLRSVEKVEMTSMPGGGAQTNRQAEALAERRKQEEVAYATAADSDVRTHFETGCGICFTGVPVKSVQTSRGLLTQDGLPSNWYRLSLSSHWADVVVDLADGNLAAACVVQDFITAMHVFENGGVNVLHRPLFASAEEGNDVIALLARLHAGTLTETEIVDAAAMLRHGKHRVLTMGPVAAQFYDSIRDIDGLRSVASYYALAGQPIPLDIVLFGGGRLFVHDDVLVADIPATKDRQPRSAIERERGFTYHATPAFSQYLVAGRVPWMRQAWNAVATAECDASAEAWRRQALAVLPHLGSGLFTQVRPEGRDTLVSLAGIAESRDIPEPALDDA
jgi:hypothetical protein